MSSRPGIMIDIETLGRGPYAVIASIAAVRFDFDEEGIDDTASTILDNASRYFYRVIDIDTQNNRRFDGETIRWWLKQSDSARMAIASDQTLPLEQTLRSLTNWWPLGKVPAFSKGATFDLTILDTAFRQLRLKPPFEYQQQLCARTVFDLSGEPKPDLELGAHNALNDAIEQVVWFQKAWRRLRGR